ncbi:MAG: hypothetical protein KDD52_08195 [Bdellovibrionales bacterium]|nr:hypothetical protein [Bdellovibrionales bacterium]
MSRELENNSKLVESKDSLLDVFRKGSRPKEEFKVGVEFERFALTPHQGVPLPYQGDPSIFSILQAMQSLWSWQPVTDQGRLIALTQGGNAITLEPGGQVELSSRAFEDTQSMAFELRSICGDMENIAHDLGFVWGDFGFVPTISLEQAQWIPKSRYHIMKSKYEGRDRSFLEMMALTASIQINFDYSSEEDAGKKVFVSSMLSPVIAALCSNSSIENMTKSNYLHRRHAIWMHGDPDRTGIPAFFVDGSFSFEQYRDYALQVPMYFIVRDGKYIDQRHLTFGQYLDQNAEVQMGDWDLHLTTLFPDLRLKNHLEARTADQNPLPIALALAVFWFVLSKNNLLLDALAERFSPYSYQDLQLANQQLITKGLEAMLGSESLLEHARYITQKCMEHLDAHDQELFRPLFELAQEGRSPGQKILIAMEEESQSWSFDQLMKVATVSGK